MIGSNSGKRNIKGFTLVEVIVVAVIVAVLALVGIQLYQGYATEARRNTAENLAASAASFLQTAVNYQSDSLVEATLEDSLDGNAEDESDRIWKINLGGDSTSTPPVIFSCPAKAGVGFNTTNGTVSANVGGIPSEGTYRYKITGN